MKILPLVTAFIFIAAVVSAQSNISVIQLSKAPKAKLTGHSNFGKVYALPQDNMPCIVPAPATAAVMPVVETAFVNAVIPNAFPKQDLIAENALPAIFFERNKIAQQPSKNLMLDLIRKK